MVVITIVSTLASAFYISLRDFQGRLDVRSGLERLVTLVRSARTDAITGSQDVSLTFQPVTSVFVSTTQGTTNVPFPKGLTVQDEQTIAFNAQGHPIQSGTVTILDDRGGEHFIAVAVGTGRVRSY